MSFFDDDDDEGDIQQVQPRAGPSRPVRREQRGGRAPSTGSASTSVGGGSRSFLSRLESTVSPGRSDRYHSHGYDDDDAMLEDEVHRAEGRLDDLELDGPGRSLLDNNDEEDESEMDDVRKMGKVWVKERGTVDLMSWEGDLIDTLFDKLEQQQKMVDTLRSDPQTSEEEHFKLVLVQTEMERVKFVVRSYVRTRLHKIEKYSHHIVLSPELHPLLSGAELSHAKRYTELLHTHFQHSVLDSLPDWLQKMDDAYGDGLSMVTKPNKNVPVLIYCRRDCGEIRLDSGEQADLAKGTTHLVKYALVERWISLGWAEVL